MCLTTGLQVVDDTEPEQTEPHSTPDRQEEADDLKTDTTEETHDKQSPRGPEKVKHRSHDVDFINTERSVGCKRSKEGK